MEWLILEGLYFSNYPPKGEVNSGDCLPGREASSYISSAVNLPSEGGGGGVVLVFTKSVG